FVNEFRDFVGISAEFQNARAWRPDWLHAVHRDAQKLPIGTVTGSATISWQRHPKWYSETCCFSYPFTRQTRVGQFRVCAGRNRDRVHLQHISIDFAHQFPKFRIIQPGWQHRDYKTRGLNDGFQGEQPRSITPEIFLRAIEIELELLQIYIVRARVAQELFRKIDNRPRGCIVGTKWTSKRRNPERKRAMLAGSLHCVPVDRRL